MARITTFEAGFCTHRACMALRGAGFAVCAFPARAYLIEAGSGRWLWDTGYASHFIDHTRSGVFAIYAKVTPVHFDAADALAAQLRQCGLQHGDIDALILSHFHGDHIAGLRDFPEVPLLCSGSGWSRTRHLQGIAALRRGFIPGLIPADFESRLRFVESFEHVALPQALAPFTQAYALPGADGEVFIVELPGHAAGHLGAFVDTEDGWVLLASDAAWSPTSYRELVGPSTLSQLIMEDTRSYYDTLRQLQQLDRGGQVRIMLTHEGAL
ncbi:MBL fold metallo-hydrolase [Dyella silvatica]|uniref:MBL fold metallo-hydrolase n=1 Tax=Dyella silvatica TaxID=2992128 RepID=UPI002255E06B|nr:MBL fold metallo-hydrolase [Dyella silvatica]